MPNARVAERRGLAKAQSNPPFDRRIVTLPGIAGVADLKRGKLKSMDPGASVGWTLRFLYNPSTIELSHSIDPNSLAPGLEPSEDQTSYLGQTLTTVSWSLLFDRTYETWDRSYADKPAGMYGVYSDVRALYGLLGMVDQKPIDGLDLISSPMQSRLSQVYFGGKNSLSYFGRIESASVQYTHWTTKMIPNRCVIGLGMSVYPKVEFDPSGPVGSADAAAGGATPASRRTVPLSARAAEGRTGA